MVLQKVGPRRESLDFLVLFDQVADPGLSGQKGHKKSAFLRDTIQKEQKPSWIEPSINSGILSHIPIACQFRFEYPLLSAQHEYPEEHPAIQNAVRHSVDHIP